MFQNNSNHEVIQTYSVILLMIPNGEGWYYLAVKQLSRLLRVIPLKTPRWLLLSQSSSFFSNKKLNVDLIKKVCEKEHFKKMPSEDTKISDFNQH